MNMYKDKAAKLLSRLAAVLCVFAAILLGCKTNVSTSIAVTGVTLDKPTISLVAGTSTTLTAIVLPANATNKTVTWSSNKPDVAAVDKDGKVTAHKAGEATITVTTTDGGKTASCMVRVTAKAPPTPTYVISFSVDGTGGTLKAKADGVTETDKSPISVEKDKTVTFTAKPADGYEVEKWTVNGTTVANNVSTTYSHKVTAAVTVKVSFKALPPATVAVTGVTLNKRALTLEEGKSEQLKATVLPEKATNKAVTWSSNKPDVAAVDKDGKVTAHKAGEATITVTTTDGGKTASCTVRVSLTEYAITYHLDGGSNHADNPAKYTVETGTITLKDAAKANYRFAGWYANAGFTGEKVTQIAKGSSGNKAFWAKWEAVTYSIIYHLNDGMNDSGNPAIYTVETETITLKDAAKANYRFAGWYANAGFTGEKVTQIAKGSSGNKAFWAKWEAVTYDITYHLDGGTNDSYNPAKYTVETGTITLKDASKANYRFAGWYEKADFTGEKVTQIGKGSTGNKELWAKFLENYSITYHLDGGSNHADNPAKYTVETGTITLKDAAKANYRFAGWYANAGFTGEKVTQIAKGSSGNKAFWAKWEAVTYSIIYHLNDGMNDSGNPAIYTVETETITLKDAERTGYAFMGWYEKADFTGKKVTQIGKGSTGNKELWAKFLENYSITYHLDGGSHSGNPANYTIETETITLKDASKANYTFAGWYEKADFTGEKVTQIGKGSSGNKELWAKFLENYAITYNLNGGSHSGNPASYTVETETITLKDAAKANYMFAGWYASADFSGEKVLEIRKGSSGNKGLYAKFIEMKMIDIAAVTGETVGHSSEYDNGEHTVSLTAYRIGESEVTQELWQAVMGNNPSSFQGTGKLPASGEVQEKRPVECVSWYECIAFCNELTKKVAELGESQCVYTVHGHTYTVEDARGGKHPDMNMNKKGFRLPTEAEWEWAAKGGTEYQWAGTNERSELENYAWYGANSRHKTHEVKQKQPNGYGLYDMSGNVYEWCWDRYESSTPTGWQDPTGAASGDTRVGRGGSWNNNADNAARAFRGRGNPAVGGVNFGLRLVSRP